MGYESEEDNDGDHVYGSDQDLDVTMGRAMSISARDDEHSLALTQKLMQDDKWFDLIAVKDLIISKEYKCPKWSDRVSNVLVVLWALTCAIITTIYCVYFDVILNATNLNEIESQCIDSGYDIAYDVSEIDWINYNKTAEYIHNIASQYYSPYNPPGGDTWGEDIETSDRFVTSIFTSYIMGLFIWGPIVYFLLSYRRYRYISNKINQVEQHAKKYKQSKKQANDGQEKDLIAKEQLNQMLLFANGVNLDLFEWRHTNTNNNKIVNDTPMKYDPQSVELASRVP